jgi:RNA polymerase sigma-70 factor (ECF subfamily)
MLDEINLIERAKSGNKSALNTLLSDNYSILLGYITKMTGDAFLSQDIVQETMLKAVLNLNKFRPEAKFSTWLITIATNVYRDHLRKFKRIEALDENFDYIASDSNIEDTIMNSMEYKKVMSILMRLSYEKRAVFILKNYYGYKYEDIANILQCPIGTVRSRLHNCIKCILEELERSEIIIG